MHCILVWHRNVPLHTCSHTAICVWQQLGRSWDCQPGAGQTCGFGVPRCSAGSLSHVLFVFKHASGSSLHIPAQAETPEIFDLGRSEPQISQRIIPESLYNRTL